MAARFFFVSCLVFAVFASLANGQDSKPNAVPENPTAMRGSPDHLVRLNFREQEWLPALKWLADELHLNLDWQSLPTDTFSLHSSQEYTLKDAEDLINMQLLARGFTLLKRGEVLRVSPLKDIDITLVPHAEPDSLATLSRHQFVRVSFSLDWMIAEQAAVEFKPLMSPFGRLFPMVTANRLEAMDAVVNLPGSE